MPFIFQLVGVLALQISQLLSFFLCFAVIMASMVLIPIYGATSERLWDKWQKGQRIAWMVAHDQRVFAALWLAWLVVGLTIFQVGNHWLKPHGVFIVGECTVFLALQLARFCVNYLYDMEVKN